MAETIKVCLQHLELYSLVIRESDKKLLIGFHQILDVFNIFTKFVQGKYCTVSNMILFYVEIKDTLSKFVATNVGVLKQCAKILLEQLPNRFDISEEMLVAAIVDPWSQNIGFIDEYLNNKEFTRLSFLEKFCREKGLSTVGSNSNCTTNDSSSSSVIMKMLQKHSNSSVVICNNLAHELVEFRRLKLPIEIDAKNNSVLKFWQEREKEFPIMASIAKKVLFLMTSNASSESSFSSSGCLINQKRASINPLKAEKVLLIYNNVWLTETSNP